MSGWRGGWYVVPHQVMYRDIDTFGHVNNAVFFTYFEWARTLLWFELAGGSEARDVGFIVARAECDFKLQVAMEPVEIWVRVGEMRNTSFDFLYEVRKGNGQQIAAVGKTVVVLFEWKTQSRKGITDEFRRRVNLLQSTEA